MFQRLSDSVTLILLGVASQPCCEWGAVIELPKVCDPSGGVPTRPLKKLSDDHKGDRLGSKLAFTRTMLRICSFGRNAADLCRADANLDEAAMQEPLRALLLRLGSPSQSSGSFLAESACPHHPAAAVSRRTAAVADPFSLCCHFLSCDPSWALLSQ